MYSYGYQFLSTLRYALKSIVQLSEVFDCPLGNLFEPFTFIGRAIVTADAVGMRSEHFIAFPFTSRTNEESLHKNPFQLNRKYFRSSHYLQLQEWANGWTRQKAASMNDVSTSNYIGNRNKVGVMAGLSKN